MYGTALPYWDQWDEAGLWFKPWLEGHLAWGTWFAPHNEHRIFFTRLLDWFVLRLNRQWDPRLQMTINAFIHAGYACGLACSLWVFNGRKHEGRICFLLLPFFALPFAAENTIHGFQSQMYFLSIFSVIAMVGLGFGSPGRGWWLGGLAAAVMSLFTMGSGLLASLAVMGLVCLRMLKQRGICLLYTSKILVVEDDPDQLEVVRFTLKNAGFAVGTATNGIEALKKAQTVSPDLIVLDVMMPELEDVYKRQGRAAAVAAGHFQGRIRHADGRGRANGD